MVKDKVGGRTGGYVSTQGDWSKRTRAEKMKIRAMAEEKAERIKQAEAEAEKQALDRLLDEKIKEIIQSERKKGNLK